MSDNLEKVFQAIKDNNYDLLVKYTNEFDNEITYTVIIRKVIISIESISNGDRMLEFLLNNPKANQSLESGDGLTFALTNSKLSCIPTILKYSRNIRDKPALKFEVNQFLTGKTAEYLNIRDTANKILKHFE